MTLRIRTHLGWLVGGLGVAQLLAWGALYYAIAVIGEAMRVDLGITQNQLFGAFTWALTLSGLLAPSAGKLLDRCGGRTVLVASTVLGALGFSFLACTHSVVGLFLGFTINGLAMALGLYDTCFAAIGQVVPAQYPRAVTGVTLIAGFSSTVTWPASHYLLHSLGWRALCGVYAVCLCVCAVIYWVVLPGADTRRESAGSESHELAPANPAVRKRARLLAWTFAGVGLIGASLSAHLLTVLTASNVSSEQAVWIASSIGVMQVLGRLLQATFGSQHDAFRLGLVTFVGFFVSAVLLLASPLSPWLLLPFALVYGVANGLVTIAKATLPIQILGVRDVGQVLGSFSRPSLVTRAIAPLWFAMTVSAFGVPTGLASIALVGALSCVLYLVTTRRLSAGGLPRQ